MLVQFIYTSSAVKKFSDKELFQLLEGAATFNRIHDITGLLLYASGTFMQVLEGAPEVVDELMRRIKLDTRHRDVNVLVRNLRTSRDFHQWHMGFRRMNKRDAKALPGYAPFFEDGFDPSRIEAEADFALEIMKALSDMATATPARSDAR